MLNRRRTLIIGLVPAALGGVLLASAARGSGLEAPEAGLAEYEAVEPGAAVAPDEDMPSAILEAIRRFAERTNENLVTELPVAGVPR